VGKQPKEGSGSQPWLPSPLPTLPIHSHVNAGLRFHISFCVKHRIFGRCCAQDCGRKTHKETPAKPYLGSDTTIPSAFYPRTGYNSSSLKAGHPGLLPRLLQPIQPPDVLLLAPRSPAQGAHPFTSETKRSSCGVIEGQQLPGSAPLVSPEY
jgi:hypothetical protein